MSDRASVPSLSAQPPEYGCLSIFGGLAPHVWTSFSFGIGKWEYRMCLACGEKWRQPWT